MVELDGVFCIKYKPKDSSDVSYGILVDEDKELKRTADTMITE